MTWLLDTSVVSELRLRRQPAVAAWLAGREPESLFLSVVTIQEIEVGVARTERTDPVQGRMLRDWFEAGVLGAFAGRVLPIDLPVARLASSLLAPSPRPLADTWIAATALVHGLTVVTRNVVDFATVPGLVVVNPWDAA